MNAIEAVGLRKEFRRARRASGVWGSVRSVLSPEHEIKVAVDDVSLTVPEGEVVGYLGPNGAGKSTTIKMLTGVLRATRGSVAILGLDPARDRRECCRKLGVLFGQRSQLWWDLPLLESFNALRYIYDLPTALYKQRFGELVDLLDMSPLLHVPVRQLSLGQRMRGELAATLLHGPQILFLDEPTIGVDAVAKTKVREFIKDLNARDGITVLLTSHDLSDVQELCRRVVLIDHGRIVYDGTPSDMTSRFEVPGVLTVELAKELGPDAMAAITLPDGCTVREQSGRRVVLTFDRGRTTPPAILGCLVRLPVTDMHIDEASVTDVFVKLYGEQHAE